MKIGIITLLGTNYGNRLQNYAVQELLKIYGEVYTVPYEKKQTAVQNKDKIGKKMSPAHIKLAINSRLLNKYHLSDGRMNTITRVLYFLKHKKKIQKAYKKREVVFSEFDKNYICYENEKLHLEGDDKKYWVKSYDAWVCGSDQIWNPTYPTATRNAFLQFAEEFRRIALSASIGISDVTKMPKEYKEWLGSIPYLSVRETTAAAIIEKMTGKRAEVFLDPTMLIARRKWERLADNAKMEYPLRFALCYFLGSREKNYQEFIDDVVKKQGLETVEMLNGEYPQYLEMGPVEMIDAIRKAEVVFVDSFHGAVFAILFHKPFMVFERKEMGASMNSRLQTLLERFELKDRVFDENNPIMPVRPIDWSKIDAIIGEEQKRVKQFLDSAMEKIKREE